MGSSLTRKLIEPHLVGGEPTAGREIALRIDQVLVHDVLGPMIVLELEAMGVDRVQPEVAVAYVDHLMVQTDERNAEDHDFLRSACRRFGMWLSPAGNGISHPVHQELFSRPGQTLLGGDSHTPANGAVGMLAIGAGGLAVALALAGEPLSLRMPKVWGVRLTGQLPAWVSAKDVILELLRRHGVAGGTGRIIEYFGPGLAGLSAMDRHVIANMGTELGATTSVFPSDDAVLRFLRSREREQDWVELLADDDADYDVTDEIDLSGLEPLIALPSSPGNVVPVAHVAGRRIGQAYIGSSANPGYRDYAIAALVVEGRQASSDVSFDINPSTRAVLTNLLQHGHIQRLITAGARLHQAGCNGCFGMGQVPAPGSISLRTVPRNFPGRSGTREDAVYLCSPETAVASALTGVITDPRTLAMPYPEVAEPTPWLTNRSMMITPLPPEAARAVQLVRGPNITSLPELEPLPDVLELPVLLTLGDDVSTDEITPAGNAASLYSSLASLAPFTFAGTDDSYPGRATEVRNAGGHALVAGRNYGQGSSREHSALVPRYLGLRVVLARSFARIHWENLVYFGVLPLVYAETDADNEKVGRNDLLVLSGLHAALVRGDEVLLENRTRGTEIVTRHDLSSRQLDVLFKGGAMNWQRERL